MNARLPALLALLALLSLGSVAAGSLVTGQWGSPPPDLAHLPVNPAALAAIDLRSVHEELIPEWVVAGGGMKRLHFDRLRREAGQDAALGLLLDRMDALNQDDAVANAPELMALVRAWNQVLERGGQPWRLSGEVRMGVGGGELLLKSYRVLYQGGQVRVGDRTFAAEVRRRADRTSLVDGWLGQMHVHQEGVVVLLDRVTAFALDEVWPMLDAELDGQLNPTARAFAPAIRAEVEAVLSDAELEALRITAEDRYWMVRAANAVAQRHRCGSAFYVARIAWNGLSPQDVAAVQQHVAPEEPPCPEVTQTEALVFAVRSAHTRTAPGLEEALEGLVGLVAHAVVVHEARHAYDDQVLAGQRIACLGCPADTSHLGALEGAAYLASFADPDTSALSLYQACALEPSQVPERAPMIAFLAKKLSPQGCLAGAPEGLADRAGALAKGMFGPAVPIEVVDFPTRLPVGESW